MVNFDFKLMTLNLTLLLKNISERKNINIILLDKYKKNISSKIKNKRIYKIEMSLYIWWLGIN
ncbi:hypothetical protein IX95_00720 [Vibrio sp. B183]|nr:hypothetical protein IX95_00720 [Vibrio sp. B183]